MRSKHLRPESLALPGAFILLAAVAASTFAGCGTRDEAEPAPPTTYVDDAVAQDTALSEAPLSEDPLIAEPVSLGDPIGEALALGESLPSPTELREPRPTMLVEVRHGESLVLLADWSGVEAEDVAELNDLDVAEPLFAGQELMLPTDVVAEADVVLARDAALERRLDRYLRGRGGLAGVETLRVRTGDTGWSIARDRVGVPIWVVAAYNPDQDLDRLSIGDSLQVPVLADTVAEAEPLLPDTVEE